MTPLEIEILLHYWARGDEYRGGDFSAPAVCETIDKFCGEWGLIDYIPEDERRGHGYATYRTTDKGKVMVKALCDVPLPVRAWIMPEER